MRLRKYIALAPLMLVNNARPAVEFLFLGPCVSFAYLIWWEYNLHRSLSALGQILNYLLDPSQERPTNLDKGALIRAGYYLTVVYAPKLIVNEAEDYPGSESLNLENIKHLKDWGYLGYFIGLQKFHEFRQLRTIKDPMRSIIIYEFPEFVEFLDRARDWGNTFNEDINKFIDEAKEICQGNENNFKARKDWIEEKAKKMPESTIIQLTTTTVKFKKSR